MVQKYLKMLVNLRSIRMKNDGKESKEEDDLLDQMDEVWLGLTEEEHKFINKEK